MLVMLNLSLIDIYVKVEGHEEQSSTPIVSVQHDCECAQGAKRSASSTPIAAGSRMQALRRRSTDDINGRFLNSGEEDRPRGASQWDSCCKSHISISASRALQLSPKKQPSFLSRYGVDKIASLVERRRVANNAASERDVFTRVGII